MGVTCQILVKQPKEKKHILGQSIIGVVKYTLSRPIQVKKVSVVLVGKGRTEWIRQKKSNAKEDPGGNFNKCIGNEKVIVEKNIFDDTRQSLTVPEGTYECPFAIELPTNIPPSVKTEICEINYFLTVKFEKSNPRHAPKRFRSQNIRLHSNIPAAIPDHPISFETSKAIIALAKLFSKNKRKQTVNLRATLENTYLISGKETRLSFVVSNDTDITVGIRTELICKTTYRDDSGNEKSTEATLKELRTPNVPEKSVANMFNIIPVWSDLYTVRYSKVMTRNYRLKITLRMPMPHTNQSIEVPIAIGERFSDAEVATMEQARSHWEILIKDQDSY